MGLVDTIRLAGNRTRGLLGINSRNLDFVFPYNDRRHIHLVDDKLCTKQLLSQVNIQTPRTICVLETLLGMPVHPPWRDAFDGFVIKPVKGSRGQGIFIVNKKQGNHYKSSSGKMIDDEMILHHVGGILQGNFTAGRADRAMFEERLIPHPDLSAMAELGLPDIRIVLFQHKPLLAMLRLPTKLSGGRANLHQGGLGLAVELSTGRVVHAMLKSKTVTQHPDTGASLLDLKVPLWKQVMENACEASRQVPLGYLGVDIVIDSRERVLVLEMNARPGLQIQNINQKGLFAEKVCE